MSAKSKLYLARLWRVIAFGFCLPSVEISKTRADDAEANFKSREQIQDIRSRRQNSIEQSASSRLIPESTKNVVPSSSGDQIVLDPRGETPAWTIPYGKEFWRRAGKPAEPQPKAREGPAGKISANGDLGDNVGRASPS